MDTEILNIFCDGSYNPQLEDGVGIYVILKDSEIKSYQSKTIKELLPIVREKCVKVIGDFKGSTDVEGATLQSAIQSIEYGNKVNIYTDCQKTQLLYAGDKNINVIKIKGHDKTALRSTPEEKIFTCVDRISRKELRASIKHQI